MSSRKEKRSLQGEKLEEVFSELLDKAVGNIKFICEFFKLNMMTEAQMHEFLTKLVRRRDAISIACFSTMLSTIGKDLDHGKAKVKHERQVCLLIVSVCTCVCLACQQKTQLCLYIPTAQNGSVLQAR